MRLTPEGRASRARHNRERKQWEHAMGHQTGPRSADGKLRSARRSLKHGGRSAGAIALQKWIASVNRLIAKH